MNGRTLASEIELLRGAMERNRAAYREMCKGESSRARWDYCILTAANTHQARGYRLELERRRRAGLLPASTRFLVVPDIAGKRIGSGGATLNVIRVVAQDLARRLDAAGLRPTDISSLFANRRILIIHSGGDSRRIPRFSCCGKIFGTIPRTLAPNTPSSVFDELMISLARLPERMDEGILIASGDVLLIFDAGEVNLRWQGVTGIAFRVPWRVGTHHGVYVQSSDATHVRLFLQKPDKRELKRHNAIDADGRVCVDTGLVRFDTQQLEPLAALAGFGLRNGKIVKRRGILTDAIRCNIPIELYDEILRPLAPATTDSEYLDVADGNLRSTRGAIWRRLRGVPFRVCVPSVAVFTHIGTTEEYRNLITSSGGLERLYGFEEEINSLVARNPRRRKFFAVRSILGAETEVGAGAIIEDSQLTGDCEVGSGAIVCGLTDCPEGLRIAPNAVLHQLVIRLPESGKTARVIRLYGVKDDPKQPLDGGKATFLGEELARWLRRRRIPQEAVWRGIPRAERCLWNARLYPIIEKPSDVELVIWMQKRKPPSPSILKRWLKAKRLSLRDSFELAHYASILKERDALELKRRRLLLEEKLPIDADCSWVWKGLDSLRAFRDVIRFARSWTARQRDPLAKMRGNKFISDVLGSVEFRAALVSSSQGDKRRIGQRVSIPPRTESDARKIFLSNPREELAYEALSRFYLKRAFDDVRRAVGMGLRAPRIKQPIRFQRNRTEVELPARIDFGGGWSDTPPHSLRRGGTVLNAAIKLNGRFPVRAAARVLKEPELRLISRDAAYELRTDDAKEILDYANPADPVALHKAALCCVGIVADVGDVKLAGRLERLGGGLEIITESTVPKGSGLGTSSIIAAALVSALFRLIGYEPKRNELFSHVSYVEQMVTTGGGWQDQIGALTPSIKLISTRAGYDQTPRIAPVRLSAATERALNRRLLLLYTGERRLAKDILQSIMGKYISGEPTIVNVLREIQDIAREMKVALERGDLDSFGELLFRHYELNKLLDAQSTTPRVERILDMLKPHIAGAKMVGAGGGGFMMLLARDERAAAKIKRIVEGEFASQGVCFWCWRLAS